MKNTQAANRNNTIVEGAIVSMEGHTDFKGTLSDAITVIMDNVKQGKWAYLNNDPYFFQSYDEAEQEKAKDLLLAADQPVFTLTGALQGGAPKAKAKTLVRGRITKKPISQMLTGKTRAQLAVSVRNDHGKEVVDVFISDYNGSRSKLQANQDKIIAAIFNGLRSDTDLRRDARNSARI